MQVRKIKEKKTEKRTRNEPSTSSSSGSPERSGEGDEAKNKKQVGNKEGFVRRVMEIHVRFLTVYRYRRWGARGLPQVERGIGGESTGSCEDDRGKIHTGRLARLGSHYQAKDLGDIFNSTFLCLLPLQLSMFHEYEFYLRTLITLIKCARNPNFVCSTRIMVYKEQALRDNIKILGHVVCPFVCKSVCVCGT